MKIDNKEVDLRSIEIDGVDTKDYPDFCDAYAASAFFVDGTELNDAQMNELNDQLVADGTIAEMALESCYG